MGVGAENRRRAARRAVRVSCQVVRERDFRLLSERALDLSPDGMFVECSARVLTGEPVVLTFRDARSGRWVDAEATVVRVVHRRRAGDAVRGLGLRFDAI